MLVAAGSIRSESGGEDTKSLEATARLVMLDALSAAASEITSELAPGSVDVRLRGRDPEFVVTHAPASSTFEDALPAAPAAPEASDDTSTTRTTLRLPDQLKGRVEEAANREGLSPTPGSRLARLPLARLVDQVGQSAHLVLLHGADVLYVIEERAPGRPPLVTDVGVRLPAHLTASDRAIVASLPAAQVRALYPDKAAFTSRTGTGPSSLSELRRLLSATRQRGYATEDGEVTAGFASIAAPITAGTIHAAVAVTWEARGVAEFGPVDGLAGPVAATAAEISRRLRH